MLSQQEQDEEIKKWGIIYNLARQRKPIKDFQHTTCEKTVARLIRLLEEQIEQVRTK